MLTHRGFSAWIVVDGRNVPEYLTAVDTTANRVSCWIPSDEGQTFSVYWRDHGGKVDSCAFINLDGYVVPGRFLFGEGMSWRGGVRTSQATERPFMFQKVPENVDGSANKDIGTIVLRIKRVKRVAAHIPNVIQSVLGSALGKRKAGDVYAGFGEEKPFYRQYSSTWAVEAYDKHESGSKQPATYVSFVFRYRTPEFLESQGITPSVKADIMKNPKRPEMGRRVVSVPAPPLPSLMTPSPSPSPPKKPRLEPSFSRNGSQRSRRPSADMRRAVSLQVTGRGGQRAVGTTTQPTPAAALPALYKMLKDAHHHNTDHSSSPLTTITDTTYESSPVTPLPDVYKQLIDTGNPDGHDTDSESNSFLFAAV